MTRRVQWIIGDDLVHHESKGKEHADADETLVVAIGPDIAHLAIRELDLTAENAGALRTFLERYLDAGHPPGEEPEIPPLPHRAALPARPGPGVRREIPGTRKFLSGMREFAAASGNPVPQTTGQSGKANYRPRPEHYAMFLAHLRQRAAAGDGTAGALLAIGRQMKLDVPDPQDAGLTAGQDGMLSLAATR
jgi:hypothetical protein